MSEHGFGCDGHDDEYNDQEEGRQVGRWGDLRVSMVLVVMVVVMVMMNMNMMTKNVVKITMSSRREE